MDDLEDGAFNIRRAVSFFVVGLRQRDDDSGKEQWTLTPCKPCRDRMYTMSVEQPEKMSGKVEVHTANARNMKVRRKQKVEELHLDHGEEPPGVLAIT